MQKLPQLTLHDLKIYQGKKVVFYNIFPHHNTVLEIFKALNIEVVACRAEQVSLENFVVIKSARIKIIKRKDLERFIKENSNIILQVATDAPEYRREVKSITDKLSVEVSPFSAGEIINSFAYLVIFKTLKNPVKSCCVEFFWKYTCLRKTDAKWDRFKRSNPRHPIIVCLPQKTADVTLARTFALLSKQDGEQEEALVFTNVLHRPRFINKLECEKKFGRLRVILGLREPIAQNLSVFYQSIANTKISYNWMYGILQGKSKSERMKIIQQYEHLATEHGDDLQLLWFLYLERYLPFVDATNIEVNACTIQQFMLEFKKYVVDITAYPFNQEKGYTIIKEGNTEVFVYQLEKLNSLVPELSEWVGVPFDQLENSNLASDKWIADSYKQAQKEIEITQEYFDKCFDEPYIKHCYSEADIEKFKARWRPHIKKEA